jgi:hypothetical protein
MGKGRETQGSSGSRATLGREVTAPSLFSDPGDQCQYTGQNSSDPKGDRGHPGCFQEAAPTRHRNSQGSVLEKALSPVHRGPGIQQVTQGRGSKDQTSCLAQEGKPGGLGHRQKAGDMGRAS